MHTFTSSTLLPSAVDVAVPCAFTHPNARNLAIARASLLQIYLVRPLSNSPDAPPSLSLSHEFKLMGVISSMARVRLPSKDVDALLLAFADAKMSLVEFSRANSTIVTVSIHYFERDEIKRELTVERHPPELRVDPQSRCAALYFFGDRMAILPFRQDVTSDPDDPSSKYPFHPSHVFKISEIDPKVRRIVDFVFLHDFFEPTLAILYETYQTWTGRLAARSDNRNLLVVSLDMTKKTFPIIYQTTHLPYNCTSLFPLTSPLGGLLIKSTNALIYVDQTSLPGVAVAFNAFYGREQALPLPPPADAQGPTPVLRDNMLYHASNVTDYRNWGLSLAGSDLAFVNPDTCVVICATGEILLVELVGHDDAGSGWSRRNGGVKRFRVTRTGVRSTVPSPGCMVRVGVSSYPGSTSAFAALNFVPGTSGELKQFFDETKGFARVHLFIGSRVSDSLLVCLTENPNGEFAVRSAGDIVDRPAENGLRSVVGVKSARMDEEDEDEDLYGGSSKVSKAVGGSLPNGPDSTASLPRFSFRVCDVLPGLGPVRDFTLGEPAKYSTDDFMPGENILRRDLEAVCCVGNGASGALGILSRNVRPKVLTTVELNEIKEVWSVKCMDPSLDAYGNDFHKFLIMSKEFGTTVLKTDEELNEISDSGFYTAGPTVFAASVLRETAIMQVQPNGVLLLDFKGQLIQNLEIGDDDTWIVSCSVVDAYVVLLMNVGDLVLLRASESDRALSIVLEKKDVAVTSASVYCSEKGSMNFLTVASVLRKETVDQNRETPNSYLNKRKHEMIDDDDDDDDLYGKSNISTNNTNDLGRDRVGNSMSHEAAVSENTAVSQKDEYYWFVYKENGALEIYLLPEFTLVFNAPRFDSLPNVVHDTTAKDESADGESVGAEINEILVARTELNDLIIYRVVILDELAARQRDVDTSPLTPKSPSNTSVSTANGSSSLLHRLSIALIRVPHTHMSRDPVVYSDTDGDKLKPISKTPVRPSFVKRHYLRPFNKIGGVSDKRERNSYCGVFMTGKKPCWIMASLGGGDHSSGFEPIEGMPPVNGFQLEEPSRASGKRMIRVHPCLVDGSVKTFAELHNVNVPYGFVYLNEMGLLRLCELPWQFNYDLEWPMCKIPLRRIPHKITYHFESQTYVLAASTPYPYNLSKAQQAAALAAGVLQQGEELEIVGERAKEDRTGLYYPSIGAFSLELISPVTWETVDRRETELIYSLGDELSAARELSKTSNAFRQILVFDIIDVVPEVDNPQTCHKFKLLHAVDEKSPITALCGINGYLLCAIGSRVSRSVFAFVLNDVKPQMIIHAFEDSDTLTGIAFLDTNIYVNNLTAVKNTIILSDMTKGVWFCGFQEDPPKLKMLGKDYSPMLTYACEFVIDDNEMAFLVSDHDKNMHILSYLPDSFQSYEGQKLIRKGEIHIGSRIQKFLRLRKLPTGKTKNGVIVFSKQFFCVGVTLDGGMNFTVPCSEKLFKRLYAVYSRMVNNLLPLAGLNPRGFRQVQGRHKLQTSMMSVGPPGPKAVLDGDVLLNYLSLPVTTQSDIARSVGSSVERIIDDLHEVFLGTEYF
ncbi:Cleavage and polyadenylation specificity factor subunit 1 [Entophlyctis luteolus]|nr:Cleavage and polyadenylation specificity factor subunit 1 [Entophlyctis luteolus]